MPDHKPRPITAWMVLLLVGLLGLYRFTKSPRHERYSAVDIVQLLGSGMCFGATLVGEISRSRSVNRQSI